MNLVNKAMKKEWWYDIFDVDRSQFDVSFNFIKNMIDLSCYLD